MKNYIIKRVSATLCAVAALVACGAKPSVGEGEFLIRGEIKSVPDGSVITLYYGDKPKRDTIYNGLFEFRDTISVDRGEVEGAIVSSSEGFSHTYKSVWLSSKAYVEIEGNSGLIANWRAKSKSKKQQSEERYREAVRSTSLLYEYLTVKINSGEIYSGEESYYLERQRDSLSVVLADKTTEYLKRAKVDDIWISRYKSSVRWASNSDDSPFDLDRLRELVDRIPDTYESDRKYIEECLVELPIADIGDKMIDGKLFDLDDNERSLSEFAGRYILIDFWGSFCQPCIMAIPEIEQVAELYAQTLSVVSINTFDKEEGWKKFCTSKEMKGNQWNELLDVSRLSRSYKVRGVPSFVLISPEGVVVDKWTGYSNGSIKSHIKGFIK